MKIVLATILVVLAAILPASASALTASQLDAVYEQATYDPATVVNVRCFYTWEGFMTRSPITDPYAYGGYVDGTAYLGDYICKRLRYIVEWQLPRSRIESTDFAYAVFALAHEVSHAYTLNEDEADCRAAQTFRRVAQGLGIGWSRRNAMAALAEPVVGYNPPVPCWP